MSAASAIHVPKVKGMSYWRARVILTQPLIFGEPLQIEAKQFVELYEDATTCLADPNDRCLALVYYQRFCFDELTAAELADLVHWLKEDDEP